MIRGVMWNADVLKVHGADVTVRRLAQKRIYSLVIAEEEDIDTWKKYGDMPFVDFIAFNGASALNLEEAMKHFRAERRLKQEEMAYIGDSQLDLDRARKRLMYFAIVRTGWFGQHDGQRPNMRRPNDVIPSAQFVEPWVNRINERLRLAALREQDIS